MTGLFSGMDLGEPEKASKPSVGGGNTFIAEYEGKYYLVPYEDNKDTAAEQFITGKLPPVGQAKSYEDIKRIQIERQKWGSMLQNPSVPPSAPSPGSTPNKGIFSGFDLSTGKLGTIPQETEVTDYLLGGLSAVPPVLEGALSFLPRAISGIGESAYHTLSGKPGPEVNRLVEESTTPGLTQSMIDKVYGLAGFEGSKQQQIGKTVEEGIGKAIEAPLDVVRRGVFNVLSKAGTAADMHGGSEDIQDTSKPPITYETFQQEFPTLSRALNLASDLGVFKGVHKGTTLAKNLAKGVKNVKESPVKVTSEQADALEQVIKDNLEKVRIGEQYEAELELELRELRNKIKSGWAAREEAQTAIDNTLSDAEAARPSLEDIARKRQEQIYQEMPDLPAQPPSTVEQPISQRTQGQEVAKINQMVKPPLTPEQKTAEAIRRGQIPQTPPETSPMPETTLAPEPRTDYRYPKPPTPIMASEKIRNLLPNENDLYRKIFVTPDKKAPAVKNLQQQPKPLADLTQEEIYYAKFVKMSPAERTKAVLEAEGVEVTPEMVEQGARAAGKIQEDLAKKAASPTISQVAPEKGVTPSGEAATQPKVKVPETKLTNDMRALGWTDAQIKEFSLGERKQVVKDQSRPQPREQDRFRSDQAEEKLAAEKTLAEKPSAPYAPEEAAAKLRKLVPPEIQKQLGSGDHTALERWLTENKNVDLEALDAGIRKITDQYMPGNPVIDQVLDTSNLLLVQIGKARNARAGIKILDPMEELELLRSIDRADRAKRGELAGEAKGPTAADLKAIEEEGYAKETGTKAETTGEVEGAKGRKGKRIRVRNAEEDRVEAQGGEVRQGWRERRQALVEQGRIKTPQQVDAAIKYEKDTRNLKGVDEAYKEWALRDPEGYAEFVKEEGRRALDLDIPEEAVDARDFMGAIRDILGNESGAWTIRDRKPKNPLERLTTLDIGAIDKIYKVARTTGMKASDLMKEAGISDETIALAEKIHATHIEPLKAKNLTPILQGPYKDRNPADVIKQGKPRMYKGQLITQPPVMRDLTELIANAPDIKGTAFESWRTPIHTFEMLPKELKERLYTTERHLEHQSNVEFKEFRDELKTVAKGLSRKNLRNVSIYGQLQQEGGAELIKALGLKEVKALTPKEKTLYDHLIKMGARAFIEQNEVRTAVGKNPLKNEPNYFTRMRSFSLAERLGLKHNHILMDEADIMANDAMHAGAAFPYSHRRARLNTQALDLDPVAVAEKYMRAHINYKNLTPFIAELQKTLEPFQAMSEAKGTKGFAPKYHKPGLTKFLTKWADYVGGTYEPPLSPAMNTALGILNKNAAFATLSNLTTAAYQPAGLVTVGALTGPRFIAQGIAKAIDPFEKTSVRQSKLLFSRAADLSYTDNSISLGKFHEKAGNAGLWLMKQMDYITAKASFIAARDYALNKGLGMKDAINWADDVVAKTQGSTMKGDTAPIQRSNLGRTATLFQTFVIANWNTLLRDVSGVLGDKPLVAKKGDLPAGTARTALRFVVGAAMANSLYDALGMRKPYPSPISTVLEGVENDDRPFKIAWDTLKESAEMMPLAGNVKFGGSFLSKPIVTLHNLMTGGPHRKTVQAELENLEEEGEFPPFIGESVGTLLGVPGTGQIAKSTRAAKRGEEGFWDLAVGRFQK